MLPVKYRQRIQALFEDIEQPVVLLKPSVEAAESELESLRQRVSELETKLSDSQEKLNVSKKAETARHRPTGSLLLYEKEKVGYAFVGEKVEPIQPENFDGLNKEQVISAPLIETGQAIGSMVVEAQPERPWTEEEESLTDAVARQVSLQIQNLRLLESAERARSEAQSATRRYMHESWDSYLDSIHQDERVGYVYDQQAVEPYAAATTVGMDYQETVSVLDEHIGRLYLKADPERPFTDEDRLLVAAVAGRLGEQVENLRLLADASRARAEAEEATRRLTREGWQSYAAQQAKSAHSFVYDTNRVSVLSETPQDVTFSQPLYVRGEPIGRLAVAGLEQVSDEMENLLSAVASQTSLHLEALRLTEELQKRAGELQELDRLKSSFLANMSHELRTPLNSILGFSDVMLENIDGPLTDMMENDLRLIQKNGQHLLLMINDILDMAKIESGRMNLHPEKFKVNEVLEEVSNITSALANNKNIAVFIEPESDHEIEIYADVTRIRQVMINVINNSIKFTDKGSVALRVDPLGSDRVIIRVRDTGIGIPQDHLETIFKEFAQVDTSTTRKVGGTGLGLPISRKLAEMHGGKMWAESTGIPGEGSSFFIELPLMARFPDVVEKTSR